MLQKGQTALLIESSAGSCSLWPLATEESSRVLHPKHFQRTHARTNDSVCPHGAGEHTRISLRPPLRSLPQSRWWGPSGGRSRGRSSRRQPACRGTLPTMPHPSPSSATIYTWNSRELAWSILPLQMPHFLEQLSSERCFVFFSTTSDTYLVPQTLTGTIPLKYRVKGLN